MNLLNYDHDYSETTSYVLVGLAKHFISRIPYFLSFQNTPDPLPAASSPPRAKCRLFHAEFVRTPIKLEKRGKRNKSRGNRRRIIGPGKPRFICQKHKYRRVSTSAFEEEYLEILDRPIMELCRMQMMTRRLKSPRYFP